MNEINEPGPMWVVTDLDGTLLDHFSYSFEAARPALERLKALNIPIIINTSKTYAEVSDIQDAIGIDMPCIVENGSAIYLPVAMSTVLPDYFNEIQIVGDKGVKTIGVERESIVAFLHRLRESYGYQFEGFSDWSIGRVAKLTGLSVQQANKAMVRYFSEPIVWRGSDEDYQMFASQIEAQGLMLLKGGRFIHVLGRCDKGQSIMWLKALYERLDRGGRHHSIKMVALGDSQNDVAMLAQADIAVVVKSPAHPFPEIIQPQGEVIYTLADGPKGWNYMISTILDRLEQSNF